MYGNVRVYKNLRRFIGSVSARPKTLRLITCEQEIYSTLMVTILDHLVIAQLADDAGD